MVGGCAHLILAIGSVLLLNVSCFTGDEDYTCVHDDTPPSPDEVYHADTGEKQRSARTLGDSFLPLRIHVHYDGSINKQLLPRATTFLRNDLIPAVTAEFRLTLRVRRTPGPIRLSRNCVDSSVSHVNKVAVCTRGCKNDTHCVHVLVPPAHLRKCPVSDTSSTGSEGKGVGDADFLLYVSALNTSACKQNAIAEALHCQLEPDLDRPVAGNVNLCPGQLAGPSFKLTEWKLAVTHELTHALGFSRRLFPFFRDVGGEPLTPRSSFGHPAIADGYYVIGERVVKEVTRTNWMVRSGVVTRTVSMLVTPAVKAEVRRHFNCVTLEGAELENQGSSGSSLSHLEKRVFENELMTAVQTPGPVLSRISLAVLQDTGWYVVNYSRAGPLAWGKGLGCDFVTKSCMEWMETKRAKGEPIMPYCDDGKPQYCSLDGSKVLECNIYKYDHELPKQFQNYAKVPGYKDRESAKFGSIITAADFCAYPTSLDTTKCWRSTDPGLAALRTATSGKYSIVVEREQVGCASGSGEGTVDDKVGKDDERDARESSPQPGRWYGDGT
ncbi:Leishmanolysin-like peptidase [Lamellibrachia satsuma]|nr:Leishmanolysin-like peptidase [Lamellibrachia satsuma]